MNMFSFSPFNLVVTSPLYVSTSEGRVCLDEIAKCVVEIVFLYAESFGK